MELVVTEEQHELHTALRRFFADKSPTTEVRRLMETTEGHNPTVWTQMADQLGLQGLAVPEQYGGAGFGLRELTIVLEEMGRTLTCTPYFSTAVLATHALLVTDDEPAKHDLLPSIAAGTTIATLAFTGTTTARRTTRTWLLDGEKTHVLDGHIADLLLVIADTPAGPTLFAAEPADLTRTLLPTMDQTRKLARLELSGTPARQIGREGTATGTLAHTLDIAAVALAAEQLGGAQRVLEMSVDHAKIRHQFGRPIGSFQAIKHKCADMLMEVESARSAVLYAATAADENPSELPIVARLAKAYCSDAFFHAAAETIQIHGGIGFTWEHDAHLYLKRAKSSQLLFGDPAHHRAHLATLLDL